MTAAHFNFDTYTLFFFFALSFIVIYYDSQQHIQGYSATMAEWHGAQRENAHIDFFPFESKKAVKAL